MKKRAIVSVVASLALAGVMCVGLAACGGANAKSIKGEEVTKEVWDAAFDFDNEVYQNFKLEIKEDAKSEMEFMGIKAKGSGTETKTYIYAEGLTYAKEKQKMTVKGSVPDDMKALLSEEQIKQLEEQLNQKIDEEKEYYVDETDGAAKYIQKVDGAWKNVSSVGKSAMAALKSECAQLPSKSFDQYTYDAAQKGYVAEASGVTYVVKFKGDKLVAVYATSNVLGTSSTYNLVLSYGGQSVKLPAVAE